MRPSGSSGAPTGRTTSPGPTAEYPDDAALLDLTLGWLPDDAARSRVLIDNPEALFGGRLPPVAD